MLFLKVIIPEYTHHEMNARLMLLELARVCTNLTIWKNRLSKHIIVILIQRGMQDQLLIYNLYHLMSVQ